MKRAAVVPHVGLMLDRILNPGTIPDDLVDLEVQGGYTITHLP